MTKWMKASKKLPPKDRVFLWRSSFGFGIGEWGHFTVDIITPGGVDGYFLVENPVQIHELIIPVFSTEGCLKNSEISWAEFPE